MSPGHSGGKPSGITPAGGASAGLAELKVADLLGLVTREDLAGLPEGPVLRTEHRVWAVLLRKVRMQRGWSRRFLAGVCCTSHQELAKLEAAQHGATAEMWLRLCGALGVPWSRFVRCAEVCAAAGW